MPAKTFTGEELSAYVAQQFEADALDVIGKINAWLARGDGVAIYENCDLGAKDLGAAKIVSYGSPAAMLETDEPPVQLPDTPNAINWRYQLHAVYRGDQVAMPEVAGMAGEAIARARWLGTHGYTATVWHYTTALNSYGPADRRTQYASGYAVKYDGQLVRDDGSRAEYPSKGVEILCDNPGLFDSLVSSGRALVADDSRFTPMYVASYNPRDTAARRDQEINPGTFQTVNFHELTPFDTAPDGPARFFHLHMTSVNI